VKADEADVGEDVVGDGLELYVFDGNGHSAGGWGAEQVLVIR